MQAQDSEGLLALEGVPGAALPGAMAAAHSAAVAASTAIGRPGPTRRELRQWASLARELLQRGWPAREALALSWRQVGYSPCPRTRGGPAQIGRCDQTRWTTRRILYHARQFHVVNVVADTIVAALRQTYVRGQESGDAADVMEHAFTSCCVQLEAAFCDSDTLHAAGAWPREMTVAHSSHDSRLAALELDAAPVEAFAAQMTAAEGQEQGAAELRAEWRATGTRCDAALRTAQFLKAGLWRKSCDGRSLHVPYTM